MSIENSRSEVVKIVVDAIRPKLIDSKVDEWFDGEFTWDQTRLFYQTTDIAHFPEDSRGDAVLCIGFHRGLQYCLSKWDDTQDIVDSLWKNHNLYSVFTNDFRTWATSDWCAIFVSLSPFVCRYTHKRNPRGEFVISPCSTEEFFFIKKWRNLL
jgi:hypothetical protein